MNEIMDITQSLPVQLIAAGKRMTQAIDERLEAVGLSKAQLWALRSVLAADELETLATVTCLADMMNTTKSNVTAMVDRLIAEGLATRQHSLEDRREVVIALTEEGQHRYQAGVEVVRAFHTELSEKFSPEEKQLLTWVLENLP